MAKLTKEQRREAIKQRAKNLAGSNPSSGKSGYYLQLPDGITEWKVEEKGIRIIDLITFDSDHDNSNYGLDKHGNGYTEGNEIYARYYGRHKIGNKWYVCPKSVDKECPFCDQQAKLWTKYNKSKDDDIKVEAKNLYAQIRALYNVRENDELFVWETTANNKDSFEKKYRSDMEDDEECFDVQFLERGKSIKLKFVDDQFVDSNGGKHEFLKLESIKGYADRDDIDESIVNDIADLNKVLEIKTYDELQAILLTAGEEDEEEEYVEEEETPVVKEEPKKTAPKKEEEKVVDEAPEVDENEGFKADDDGDDSW